MYNQYQAQTNGRHPSHPSVYHPGYSIAPNGKIMPPHPGPGIVSINHAGYGVAMNGMMMPSYPPGVHYHNPGFRNQHPMMMIAPPPHAPSPGVQFNQFGYSSMICPPPPHEPTMIVPPHPPNIQHKSICDKDHDHFNPFPAIRHQFKEFDCSESEKMACANIPKGSQEEDDKGEDGVDGVHDAVNSHDELDSHDKLDEDEGGEFDSDGGGNEEVDSDDDIDYEGNVDAEIEDEDTTNSQ